MVQFRRFQTSLFVMLLLLCEAVTGQSLFIATLGAEVTLPCDNVIKDQDKCNSTSWVFNRHVSSSTAELINLGQISEGAKSKSDRLSVTATCSLVIKKVTVEDVGLYTCRQFRSGQQQGEDSLVHLSVINMNEQKDDDKVTFSCSVLTYKECRYTVTWLYEGDDKNTQTSADACSVKVTFAAPHFNQRSNYHDLLKCNMTDNKSGETLLCDVTQSSCEKTERTLRGRNEPSSEEEETTKKQEWWHFVIMAVGVAALLVVAVAVVRWKKTKGNKSQRDENLRLSLNPAVTNPGPETQQHDTADPEDDVSYASISYTKKSSGEVRVCVDEDEAVTYSTVKVPSSPSTAASADLSDLYVSVNKPKKHDAAV